MLRVIHIASVPNCSIKIYVLIINFTSQHMKDGQFNSLSYDVLFNSIAYDLIELEIFEIPSIKPAATVRYSPVFFLSLANSYLLPT